MPRTIWFDMDGTIADLYSVDNWLPMLREENSYPYIHAKPMDNLSTLINVLQKLKKNGYNIGIISWTSKTGSANYNKRVRAAKVRWIKKYFDIVDTIHVIKYGTLKAKFAAQNDILFDDEILNCQLWKDNGGISCHVSSIADIENFCYNLLEAAQKGD